MLEKDLKKQTVFTFIILCPLFLAYNIMASKWYDGSRQDFSQYWQGGHMILSGQNVYDSAQWVAEHVHQNTAFHTEPTFQYPLPLAMFFALIAWLPVQSAYILWLFLMQMAVVTSVILLLAFYPTRSGYLGLLAIGGVFFFRPMFSIINSGQILPMLLLVIVIAIRLFHNQNWFWGGFILSVLSLKPSVGFPVLILAGLWMLSQKQWRSIGGMAVGGCMLVLIGMLVNYHWIIDYISVGGYSLQKYYGMQPTLWGAVDKIFKIERVSLAIGFVCAAAIFAIEAYLFWGRQSRVNAFPAFASIVPAALLVAPYSWHHDQSLLIVSIVFLLINIAAMYGTGKAAFFMLGIVALAFAMLAVAYSVGHDVWSVMNSFVIWVLSLYFVTKNSSFLKDDGVTANMGQVSLE